MGLLLEMPVSENIDAMYACKCNCNCKPTIKGAIELTWYPEAEFTWFKQAESAFKVALLTGRPVVMLLSSNIDEKV